MTHSGTDDIKLYWQAVNMHECIIANNYSCMIGSYWRCVPACVGVAPLLRR